MACCDGYDDWMTDQEAPQWVNVAFRHIQEKNYALVIEMWKQHVFTVKQNKERGCVQNGPKEDFRDFMRWTNDHNAHILMLYAMNATDLYEGENTIVEIFQDQLINSPTFMNEAQKGFSQDAIDCIRAAMLNIIEKVAEQRKMATSRFVRMLGYDFLAKAYLCNTSQAEKLSKIYDFEKIAYDSEGFNLIEKWSDLKKNSDQDALNIWLASRFNDDGTKLSMFGRLERYFWSTLPDLIFSVELMTPANYQDFLNNLNPEVLSREIEPLLKKNKDVLMKSTSEPLIAFLRKTCNELYQLYPTMTILKDTLIDLMWNDVSNVSQKYSAIVSQLSIHRETSCIIISFDK